MTPLPPASPEWPTRQVLIERLVLAEAGFTPVQAKRLQWVQWAVRNKIQRYREDVAR